MKECSKSIVRRLSQPNFINKYFVGRGLDIGGKPDPLSLYRELFGRMESVRTWDLEDGDAQYLKEVSDELYDFVHSSHCLEHINDPKEGLRNWFRVVKQGGYLIITVPDEDMYEQGMFPSTFNLDHKWTFTVYKEKSWSNKSLNVIELVASLGAWAEVVKIELLNSTYRYELPRYDQTQTPVGESGIEVIVRKRLEREVISGGRLTERQRCDDRELRIHLNQYRDDRATLKEANRYTAPFNNDKDL